MSARHTLAHDHDHPRDLEDDHGQGRGERATRLVLWLTLVTMVAEIAAGWAFGSMALLADGWHMAGHAGAMGVALFAYGFARKNETNPAFAFGAGKVYALAGFANGVSLALVAVYMAGESVVRLFTPVAIEFNQALGVAVIGLIVNLASARLMHGGHEHDHNLKAAYFHVLADALTSVTAIAALIGGKYYGLVVLDPLMGVAGALVIAKWSLGLVRETARVLLDRQPDSTLAGVLKSRLEKEGTATVSEVKLWCIGPGKFASAVSVEDEKPRDVCYYKDKLSGIPQLGRVIVEVHEKPDTYAENLKA
jgi:cation diffusion facilitator family transporter